MRRSAEYCIDLPEDFPEQELTRYMAFARKVLLEPQKSPAWSEFGGASNLIAWHYRASYEDWQYYKESENLVVRQVLNGNYGAELPRTTQCHQK
jgi:hypothetical protein